MDVTVLKWGSDADSVLQDSVIGSALKQPVDMSNTRGRRSGYGFGSSDLIRVMTSYSMLRSRAHRWNEELPPLSVEIQWELVAT